MTLFATLQIAPKKKAQSEPTLIQDCHELGLIFGVVRLEFQFGNWQFEALAILACFAIIREGLNARMTKWLEIRANQVSAL